jgi:hypothetical protein
MLDVRTFDAPVFFELNRRCIAVQETLRGLLLMRRVLLKFVFILEKQ